MGKISRNQLINPHNFDEMTLPRFSSSELIPIALGPPKKTSYFCSYFPKKLWLLSVNAVLIINLWCFNLTPTSEQEPLDPNPALPADNNHKSNELWSDTICGVSLTLCRSRLIKWRHYWRKSRPPPQNKRSRSQYLQITCEISELKLILRHCDKKGSRKSQLTETELGPWHGREEKAICQALETFPVGGKLNITRLRW